MRRVALTAALGAVVGAGLAALGAVAWSRAHGDAPASEDAGSREAFLKAVAQGPMPGPWKITDGETVRRRQFADDPFDPGVVRTTYLDRDGQPVEKHPRGQVARAVAGEFGLFLDNYTPIGASNRGEIFGRRVTITRWERKGGVECAVRVMYVDEESRELVKIEDRTWNDKPLHVAELEKCPECFARPRPAATKPPLEGASQTTFDAWVKASAVPIYEPARLPSGFRRVRHGMVPLKSKVGAPDVDLYALGYGDGIAKMLMLIVRREDMKTLVDVAGSIQREPDTCPALGDKPEDLFDGPDGILVRRRADACRTVLQRDDLPGVCVVLVGFNEIPSRLYVETIRSLELAPGSRDTPLPK
jgi:hypothetical protein